MQYIMDILVSALTNMRFIDIVDIAIVAFIFYKLLTFIKETRAEQLVKGLVFLFVTLKVSEIMDMYVIHYILNHVLTIGFLALIVVFQPELRRGLEYIGRNKLINKPLVDQIDDEVKRNVEEIVKAVTSLSKAKTGALIVIERETGLAEIAETGVKLDSLISAGLLINIFEHNTPLHDGAVVIKGDRIRAAGCFLPLTESNKLSKQLGTRHRAALGIAEQSDAITVVVSEETGAISLTRDGGIQRFIDTNTLESILKKAFKREELPTFFKKREKNKDE